MSNFAQRILSSIVFVALIIVPLFLSSKIAYSVYAILGAFTLSELLRIANRTGTRPHLGMGLLTYFGMVLAIYQWGFGYFEKIAGTVGLVGSLFLISWVVETLRTHQKPFENLGTLTFSILYVSSSFLGIIYFLSYRTDLPQPWIVISLFALIWVNDSAAYLLGRKIGRTKLAPRLSPGKTIEGSASGLVFAMLAAYGLSQLPDMPSVTVMFGFGFICVVSGSLGDLLESRLKRAADVKDSGRFLPGHGGFLDRFDAMMLAIPSSILFFELVLPKS